MDPRTLIDDLLEITVVGSFSRLGYASRRRLFGWPPFSPRAMAGRTAVITGPTSGLGRATATILARMGARVVLVGRDREKLTALRDELVRSHGDDRFPTVVADMASLTSVGAAVERLLAEPRLDVLIENAGAIHPARVESPDGIEATLATMVVAPFAMRAGLLPLLRATPHARAISIASGGQYAQALDLDDLEWRERPWDGTRAYAQAKRAQVSLTREWARRVAPDVLVATAMHPGWADTPGVVSALPRFHRVMGPILRTPAEGADTTLWLAALPDATPAHGRFLLDRRARPFDRVPATRVPPETRRALWDRVVALAGVPDPAPDPAAPSDHHDDLRRTP